MSSEQDQKLQLVLTNEEWGRYLEVLRRAKGKNPRLKNSDINRVLLGLAKPNDAITAEDIQYFQQPEVQTGRARVGKSGGRRPAGKRKVNGG